MNTLVLFVGEQPVPNLLPIRHFQPEIVVAVYTSRTSAIWARIAAILPTTVEIVPVEVDPYNIQSIIEELRSELVKRPRENATFNLTGGTKPMSLAGYQLAEETHAPFVYLQSEGARSRLFEYQFKEGRVEKSGETFLSDLIGLDDYVSAHLGKGNYKHGGFSSNNAGLTQGGKFEQCLFNVLEGHADEIWSSVSAHGSNLEIDLMVRCGNQVAIIEAKDENPNKKGIDQLNTAGGRQYLGTYTRKFLATTRSWAGATHLTDLAVARGIEIIELLSYRNEALSVEDETRFMSTILSALGK